MTLDELGQSLTDHSTPEERARFDAAWAAVWIYPRCPYTARDGHSRCGRLTDHDGFHSAGNGSGRR